MDVWIVSTKNMDSKTQTLQNKQIIGESILQRLLLLEEVFFCFSKEAKNKTRIIYTIYQLVKNVKTHESE